MKSTITTQDTQPPAITYPCLMESPKGLIVMFTDEQTGTVVHVGESDTALGEHSNDWIPATSTHWTRFNGTLNLSNN
jgi:hypothetical protein